MKLSATAAASVASLCPFHLHWSLYPASYSVKKTSDSIEIDGNVDKPVWQTVPWSEPFHDITGASPTIVDDDSPQSNSYKPALTRFKALYDDDYLYIAAELHASDEFPTMAKYTERNSPIYQLDSDFEVFIDFDGSTHNYKELELNAINTVWNLMLDKPYRNGGHEHSGRVAKFGEKDYYDVLDQVTATRLVSGTLNDNKTHQGATWTVEVKWSFRDLLVKTRQPDVGADSMTTSDSDSPTPKAGIYWRINFSRVELQGKVNWTWQKQVVWDPSSGAFRGFVDMHLPDAWGYLVFVDGDDKNEANALEKESRASTATSASTHSGEHHRDPSWPARLTAMNIYYALQDYFEDHREYTNDLRELKVHPGIVLLDVFAVDIRVSDDKQHFVVRVQEKDSGMGALVREDRLILVIEADKFRSS